MPVGTNGCHQGTENPATASSERPHPQRDLGIPGAARKIPAPLATYGSERQSAGQARTGTGTVRSPYCLDAPGSNSLGELQNHHDDGMI